HGDERAGRDEVHQPAEERPLPMDRVVPLGEVAVHADELEADDLEPALLEPADDPAGQEALDTVGLDEDEGAVGHEINLRSGRGSGGWWPSLGQSRLGGPAHHGHDVSGSVESAASVSAGSAESGPGVTALSAAAAPDLAAAPDGIAAAPDRAVAAEAYARCASAS